MQYTCRFKCDQPNLANDNSEFRIDDRNIADNKLIAKTLPAITLTLVEKWLSK